MIKQVIFLLSSVLVFPIYAYDISLQIERFMDEGGHETKSLFCHEMQDICDVSTDFGNYITNGKLQKSKIEFMLRLLDQTANINNRAICSYKKSQIKWNYKRLNKTILGDYCPGAKHDLPNAILLLENAIAETKTGPVLKK